jgi:hypothetical protein
MEALRKELRKYNIPSTLRMELVAWVEGKMSSGVDPIWNIEEDIDRIKIEIYDYDYTTDDGQVSHWPFLMASTYVRL